MAARPCPKCGRPIAETGRLCLYCGTRVSPSDDGLSTPLSSLGPVEMPELEETGIEDYLVMVTPPRDDAAAMAGSIAAASGLDAFIARQRLLRGKPFVVAGGLSLDAAGRIHVGLTEIGIPASIFSETMVAALPDPSLATSGSLGEESVTFALDHEPDLEIPFSGVFLVVQGEVHERRAKHEVRKLTAGSSGYHGPRAEVKEVEVSHTQRSRVIVDVYHTLAARAVRLDEDRFRFAEGTGSSVRGRLVGFVKALRGRSDREVFDASFGSLDAVQVVARRKVTSAHVHDSSTSVSDNVDEFDTYSASLFLHVLRLRRGA